MEDQIKGLHPNAASTAAQQNQQPAIDANAPTLLQTAYPDGVGILLIARNNCVMERAQGARTARDPGAWSDRRGTACQEMGTGFSLDTLRCASSANRRIAVKTTIAVNPSARLATANRSRPAARQPLQGKLGIEMRILDGGSNGKT